MVDVLLSPDDRFTLDSLTAKRDLIEDSLSTDMRTRVRRVLSWLERARQEEDDKDGAFMFYWIAFEAVYAEWTREAQTQREDFREFFEKAAAADTRNTIRDEVLGDLADTILEVVANPYIFEPFWDCYNGNSDSDDEWQELLISDVERVSVRLEDGDAVESLAAAFERLCVVRNQIFRGEATWNRYVNRSQIEDGTEILAFVVPVLVDLILDKPEVFDRPSRYPSVESDTAETVEDVADYAIAVNVHRRIRDGQERVYSSAEVRKELGLDD
ncbi:MAG: hypothetical protein OXD46_06370 [Chloroflexi bacterium]|nr:hypothetical protein [Chloroflexota bacterium]